MRPRAWSSTRVFITGMEEGLFPHENSMSDYDGPGGRAPADVRGDHARAQRLYMSHSARRACCTARPATTSRAASSTSCPKAALKWLTPHNQGFALGLRLWRRLCDRARRRWRQQSMVAAGKRVVRAARRCRRRRSRATARGCARASRCSTTSSARAPCCRWKARGDDARAQINFPRHGMKWLALLGRQADAGLTAAARPDGSVGTGTNRGR